MGRLLLLILIFIIFLAHPKLSVAQQCINGGVECCVKTGFPPTCGGDTFPGSCGGAGCSASCPGGEIIGENCYIGQSVDCPCGVNAAGNCKPCGGGGECRVGYGVSCASPTQVLWEVPAYDFCYRDDFGNPLCQPVQLGNAQRETGCCGGQSEEGCATPRYTTYNCCPAGTTPSYTYKWDTVTNNYSCFSVVTNQCGSMDNHACWSQYLCPAGYTHISHQLIDLGLEGQVYGDRCFRDDFGKWEHFGKVTDTFALHSVTKVPTTDDSPCYNPADLIIGETRCPKPKTAL